MNKINLINVYAILAFALCIVSVLVGYHIVSTAEKNNYTDVYLIIPFVFLLKGFIFYLFVIIEEQKKEISTYRDIYNNY
jgi:heme A synthase